MYLLRELFIPEFALSLCGYSTWSFTVLAVALLWRYY
jgi:hypothetical protein